MASGVKMGGGCGVGNAVGTSVTNTTSGVEVGITVGGTGVRVGALVAVASFIPSEGKIPQAPIMNAMRIMEDNIATCCDRFIRYLTFIIR
jgi:hypothetical protein